MSQVQVKPVISRFRGQGAGNSLLLNVAEVEEEKLAIIGSIMSF